MLLCCELLLLSRVLLVLNVRTELSSEFRFKPKLHTFVVLAFLVTRKPVAIIHFGTGKGMSLFKFKASQQIFTPPTPDPFLSIFVRFVMVCIVEL